MRKSLTHWYDKAKSVDLLIWRLLIVILNAYWSFWFRLWHIIVVWQFMVKMIPYPSSITSTSPFELKAQYPRGFSTQKTCEYRENFHAHWTCGTRYEFSSVTKGHAVSHTLAMPTPMVFRSISLTNKFSVVTHNRCNFIYLTPLLPMTSL